MKLATIASAIVVTGILVYASGAFAWDDANCREECRRTATIVNGYAICVANNHCDLYRGGLHANKAQVQNAVEKYKREHGR